MADIDFPCSLPGVLLASLSIKEDEHFRMNPVQSGPPISELLTDYTSMNATVSWSFNMLEYQAFDAWFKYKINFGATPFNIDLPVGAGLVTHECYFLANPTKSRNGRRNSVSARLVAKELVYQEECSALDLLALLDMADVSCGDQCDFFAEFVNFGENILPEAWENIKYGTDYS